jgi:hypothetical protein
MFLGFALTDLRFSKLPYFRQNIAFRLPLFFLFLQPQNYLLDEKNNAVIYFKLFIIRRMQFYKKGPHVLEIFFSNILFLELSLVQRNSAPERQCLICDDRATGLHYGIISCEGMYF